jgi:hypothetical protein
LTQPFTYILNTNVDMTQTVECIIRTQATESPPWGMEMELTVSPGQTP